MIKTEVIVFTLKPDNEFIEFNTCEYDLKYGYIRIENYIVNYYVLSDKLIQIQAISASGDQVYMITESHIEYIKLNRIHTLSNILEYNDGDNSS